MPQRGYDAIVIGAGFYGLSLALHLGRRKWRVLVVEADSIPMSRASWVNQARVHAGFHYPRNFVTALRSLHNYPRFVEDFRSAIVDDFQMLYAIARHRSKVNAKRFQSMFTAMRAPIDEASPVQRALFNSDLIESVFVCRESAVDCTIVRSLLIDRIACQPVELTLAMPVERVVQAGNGVLNAILRSGAAVSAPYVFNVSYSQLNALLIASGQAPIPLKHELAEVVLIEPPADLAGMAVTVMDGPFFSVTPFPARKLYSLTHVRYTPHLAWRGDENAGDAHAIADRLPRESNWQHMLHDAQRYMPALVAMRRRESLFTVKTGHLKNDYDDGRPILFRPAAELPGLYSILGSKLDNIYDLFEVVDRLERSSASDAVGF
jgi:glycine/D-amino acid oxidase-like deaminating enzyme